jgi:CRISPR-associated protein Csd2
MQFNDTVTDPARRHDFVLLFDVQDGNPNGDPDAGNLPRVDPETMQGIATDVSLKRRVRDWVDAARGSEGRFKIYVQNTGEALNAKHKRAYEELGIRSTGAKQRRDEVDRAREWMCANFYDVRMFGAVMSTGVNAGQVRGPLQLTFARSIDPIVQIDNSITRVAVTREDQAAFIEADDESDPAKRKQTEMGRKATVPYALYRTHGFYSPHFAQQTGVQREDLELFWQALINMWDLDRSSSRGLQACRGLFIFSHDTPLGNAPAHTLFERVQIKPVQEQANAEPPRSFAAYRDRTTVTKEDLPAGVTFTELVA